MQVVGGAEFRGRVSGEGRLHLVAGDAGAVVLDLDGSRSALFDGHRDLGGAGVDGVFDQFLDYGGWPFYDLTGGDLRGDGGRKDSDVHGDSFP